MTKRTASCICGQLNAETTGEPARTLMCSCGDCRAKSGSAFAVSTYWDKANVETNGQFNSYTRAAPDGRTLTYHFCPSCGVSVYWEAGFAPRHFGIGGGNFAEMDFARPSRAYWTEQCPDWVDELNDIPRLDRQ